MAYRHSGLSACAVKGAFSACIRVIYIKNVGEGNGGSEKIVTLQWARRSYLDSHRTTARERYELLMHCCPGIVQHLPLAAIASFLNVTPQMLSKIRKDITFDT